MLIVQIVCLNKYKKYTEIYTIHRVKLVNVTIQVRFLGENCSTSCEDETRHPKHHKKTLPRLPSSCKSIKTKITDRLRDA